MKNKIISLVSLLICLLTLTASTKSFVSDPQGLFDNQTKELVNQKIQPLKNQIIIAVALQNKKKNVQIIVGKNYQDPLTQSKCGNIVRYAGNKLRSEKAATFNSGIRLVFNACATLVAQKDKLSYDKNSLTQDELQKIDHPQSVNLVWGLVIAALISFGLVLFKSFRKKK